VVAVVVAGCSDQAADVVDDRTVPRAETWGIYALDPESGDAVLIFSSPRPLGGLRVNAVGDRLVFSQRVDGDGDEHGEICTLHADGTGYRRLTDNAVIDVYPCWSPEGTEIAFLSWRDADVDIYVMDSSGGNLRKLYDSGFHDADIDWVGDWIAFTRNSQIWLTTNSGDGAHRVTDPPRAGQWGNCDLPFGDYDPRLSPDASTIVFERLEDDASVHGNYNIFVIDTDGTGELRLTNTGWSQGLATWSRRGDKIAYLVAAVGDEGRYDIYVMNADGTDNRPITPSYFPADFLCHSPVFSTDDSRILFIGQWWE
jgi:Tol biopolymer transport system component